MKLLEEDSSTFQKLLTILCQAILVITSSSYLFLAARAQGQHCVLLQRWQRCSAAGWEASGGADTPFCWRNGACREWPFCHGCQSVSQLILQSEKERRQKNSRGEKGSTFLLKDIINANQGLFRKLFLKFFSRLERQILWEAFKDNDNLMCKN